MRRRLIRLAPGDPFPDYSAAHDDLGGLLASGADLSPQRLLMAYALGIFPWYSEGDPILWWSPDPRMVLFTDEFHISRSLAKRIRQQHFEIRVNSAFEQVMQYCAEPRPGQDGTWILPEMQAAYLRLHRLGFAHSVEAWQDGVLVGGIYGIAIGRMFFGESMFHRRRDASKVALAHLVGLLQAADMPLLDCQQQTRHMASLGARPISRADFVERLRVLISRVEPWVVDRSQHEA